jgi:hypothetical protein
MPTKYIFQNVSAGINALPIKFSEGVLKKYPILNIM